MKKYYNLVVSILDEDENRVDSYDVTGSTNKKEILDDIGSLEKAIENGYYDHLKRENCTLSADIEVYNNDTWELLYIM